ncbi:hypothetical protein Tco_0083952 [Tanacetum coccineum]
MRSLTFMIKWKALCQNMGRLWANVLPFVISDHSAAVLTIPKSIPKKFKAFRFANYVVDKPEFKNIVKKGWEVEIEGCNMFRVVKKLKALKSPLNKLNWRKGNLFAIVTKLKKELKQAQIQMEKNPHNSELKKIETECLENYMEAVNDAEKLLFQSAKIEWLKNNFFKKSWMIIGKDVCSAIRDFFTNGKLLGEVFSLMVARKVASNPAFKYHKGCKELKLTHLSFVDDLLVMSHGDHVSVSLIKDALSEFSESFGLKPNMIKYLGIPLLSKKIGISDCKVLVDKVKSKVNDWKHKTLSYAGRLQLIASVLSAMQTYWASVMILPKTIVKEINSLLKNL